MADVKYSDMIELDKIYNEDCLEGMKCIPDGCIDAVICDLPYGLTQCPWDSVIPLDKLWAEYHRITKPNAAIVLFGIEPFSSTLIAAASMGRKAYGMEISKRFFSDACNALKTYIQPDLFNASKEEEKRRIYKQQKLF